jgi:predicted nucleic acid-binding protein
VNASKREVIVDTGFMVGLLHQKDQHHANSRVWEHDHGHEYEFISTELVVQEIFWLLKKKVNYEQAVAFASIVNEEIKLIALPIGWHKIAVPILNKFSDLELDLADVSLVVLANQVGHGRILTVDVRDFSCLRWGGNKHFENLLYPQI